MEKLSNRHQRLCMAAKDMALKSPMLHRHGCILAKGCKILSRGYNHYRHVYSHKGKFKCSCHAEIHTIRRFMRGKVGPRSSQI